MPTSVIGGLQGSTATSSLVVNAQTLACGFKLSKDTALACAVTMTTKVCLCARVCVDCWKIDDDCHHVGF